MMDVGRRRGANVGAEAGAVWDNRIKLYDIKGAIKSQTDQEIGGDKKLTVVMPKPRSPPVGVSSKRKIFMKSQSIEGSPVQISRKRCQLSKSSDEHCRDLTVKSPVKIKNTRSVVQKEENSDPNPAQLVKSKSAASIKDLELKCEETENSNSLQLVEKAEVKDTESEELLELEGNKEINPKNAIQETRSEEVIEVCEEKVITSKVESQNLGFDPELGIEDEDEELGIEEDDEEEEIEEKIEINSKVDVKEMIRRNSEHQKPKQILTEEKKPVHVSDESHLMSSPQCRLQSLVDLVMWRDSSRSALMFGVGTFLIISSSYTQDLKFSLISVASYMSLLYLGVIFLFKSLPHREAIGMGKRSEYVIGEEEAIWVLRRILPYINELLLKIRALFSGDPATTMKMAVLLFVLAQCGSSLTIWKMAKLGFFGVFTVPKVCSSYSAQLTTYGMFWIRRFRDAWESCTHKKAVAFGIFTLVWNLSSLAARIWAAFMLYVAFRYYQESKVREEEDDEGKSVKPEEEVAAAAPKIGPRHVGRQRRPIFMDTAK